MLIVDFDDSAIERDELQVGYNIAKLLECDLRCLASQLFAQIVLLGQRFL